MTAADAAQASTGPAPRAAARKGAEEVRQRADEKGNGASAAGRDQVPRVLEREFARVRWLTDNLATLMEKR
jgi:hypothetical protein